MNKLWHSLFKFSTFKIYTKSIMLILNKEHSNQMETGMKTIKKYLIMSLEEWAKQKKMT